MKQIFNNPEDDGMTRPRTWAHLTPETLEAALGETEQQADRAPLRHLLLVCDGCRAANPWLARLWEQDLLPCTASLLEIEAACSEVQAEDLWPEIEGKLLALPGDRWLALIGSEVPRTWGVAVTTARRSLAAAREDGNTAAGFARLAMAVAAQLTEDEVPGTGWLRELSAYCRATLGNALRVLGILPAAEVALEQALAELDVHLDPPDYLPFRCEIHRLWAALHKVQRHYPDALAALAQAEAAAAKVTYRPVPGVKTKLLLLEALVHYEKGDIEAAAAVLGVAEAVINDRADIRLRLMVSCNRVVFLTELGRLGEAEARLQAARRLLKEAKTPLDEIRLAWAEARLHAARRRTDEARASFERVRRDFLKREMALDVALVTLELALLLVQEGEAAAAAEQALAVKPELERLGLNDDAAAAMRIAWEAARSQALEAAVLEELVGRLKDLHRRHGG